MLPLQKSKDIGQLTSRLVKRIEKINSVQQQFIGYIYKLQNLYEQYGNKVNEEMMQLEQEITGISVYSSEKSIQIIRFCSSLKEIGLSIATNAQVNLLNLKQLKKDKVLQQQEKLVKKSQTFLRQFNYYLTFQKSYNNNHLQYLQNCDSLHNLLLLYQDTSNPVNFYNETAFEAYLKDLEKQHQTCSTQQTDLSTQVQVLDQKRKWLSEHLKQVTDTYVALLHNHLVRIQNVCVYITDSSKVGNASNDLISKEELSNFDQFEIDEMQRLDNVYKNNSKAEEDIFADYSDLFATQIKNSSISPDYKFFLDRCIDFRDKKVKHSKQTLGIKNLLIKKMKQIVLDFTNFQNEFKNIEKMVYGINRVDNHKKRFKKYFGDNFSEIQELCLTIIERPRKSFEKILTAIKSQDLKMQKICQVMQNSVQIFQKRTKAIFNEHQKIKKKVESTNEIDGETFQKYKASVKNSFNDFKQILGDLQSKEKQFNHHYANGVQSLTAVIKKQSKGRNLTRLIQKDINRFNILKGIQTNSEVIAIIKSETKYQILFSEALKPNLTSNFSSKIQEKKYMETKKILQKKETQSKLITKRQHTCCGMISESVAHHAIANYSCFILVHKQKIPGQLSILIKGLRFKEKSFNPFKNLLKLIIPEKEICEIQSKIDTETGHTFVIIVATMGPLTLVSQNGEEIKQQIQKNLSLRDPRDILKDKQRSIDRRDKRNDSSSFLKLNTSTEYKLSFDEGSAASKITNPKNFKKGQILQKSLIQKLIEQMRSQIFFDEKITPKISLQNKNKLKNRIDYQHIQNNIKINIKQKRQFKLYQGMINEVVLNLNWKVSFPQFQILNSYSYSETIKFQIGKTVKIHIEKDKFIEEAQFLKVKFYEEISKMNESLCQYVMKVCQRQVEVYIKQQSQSEEKSLDFFLFDQNQENTQLRLQNLQINSQQRTSGLKFNKGIKNSQIIQKNPKENILSEKQL